MKTIALIAVVTLIAHWEISNYNRIDRLEERLGLANEAEKISRDQVRDLMYTLQRKESELSAIESKGYVAGILDAMSRPDHYQAIWHDGYDRGQDTKEQMEESVTTNKVMKTKTQGK